MELGFDWEASAYGADHNTPDKPDQRKIPALYGIDKEVCTFCRVDGNFNECKFGTQKTHGTDCTYYVFGFMCTKLTVGEEEIN